jgi:hypothetical protein
MIDLDMVSSRLVGLTWRQQPSIRNRWFLFERIKLERLERNLLGRPWQVLFSNPIERDQMALDLERQGTRVRLGVLPNIMVAPTLTSLPEAKPIILFFGSLNSSANTDAFRYHAWIRSFRASRRISRNGTCASMSPARIPPPWFSGSSSSKSG